MAISTNNINKVYITGDDEVRHEFTNIGRETVSWNEVVWGGGLTRSNTFALENIDDVDIGTVPQLTLNFKYLKMEDFIVLQKLLKQRHLIIEYFDFDIGERVTHEMAITSNERKKFYSLRGNLEAIQDYTIKFVGTNRDYKYVDLTITYEPNGADSSVEIVETHTITNQVTLNDGNDFYKSGYHIKEWNTKADGSGHTYGLNANITLWQSLTLYAIWEA